MRTRTPLLLTAAVVLAACGADDDTNGAQTTPDEQSAPEAPDEAPGEDGTEPGDDPLRPDEPEMDLPDPNEMVSDGEFRGEGIVLPAPDGWTFDEMALMQGIVSASTEDGLEQYAGQAIDTDDVPDEDLSVDALVAANREQVPGDPSVDEAVDLEGAAEAHQLRFDEVPAQMEGQPESSVLMVVADDGDGRVAVFNYAASMDDFDDDHAELLLDTAGFDPDSDPTPPAPMPAPEGEQAPAPEGEQAPELDGEEAPELDGEGADDAPEADGPDDAPADDDEGTPDQG